MYHTSQRVCACAGAAWKMSWRTIERVLISSCVIGHVVSTTLQECGRMSSSSQWCCCVVGGSARNGLRLIVVGSALVGTSSIGAHGINRSPPPPRVPLNKSVGGGVPDHPRPQMHAPPGTPLPSPSELRGVGMNAVSCQKQGLNQHPSCPQKNSLLYSSNRESCRTQPGTSHHGASSI